MSAGAILLRSAAALVAGLAVPLCLASETVLSLLTQATIYAVLATGLGILVRQNGTVSFGHAVFSGFAGYAVALLIQTRLVPAEAAIGIALLAVAALAFVYGLIVVRVPGIAFGMITLAVGQVFFITAARSRGLTGGADGLNIDWPAALFGVPVAVIVRPGVMFVVSWVVLVAVVAAVALLLRGHFGAVTEATRDNEERARFIGVVTLWPRVLIFTLSGLVTSTAGVLSALYTGFVSPESMDLNVSAMALMMVVVGGTRAQAGPALGAYAYVLVKDVLGDYADHWMAFFGVALIAVIVFSPDGMAGWIASLRRRLLRRGSAPQAKLGVTDASSGRGSVLRGAGVGLRVSPP